MSSAGSEQDVPDDFKLLRRLHPNQVIWDTNKSCWRGSSAAFRDPSMSVDVEDILTELGLDWKFSLRAHNGYSLLRLTVGDARNERQKVTLAPEVDNASHAEVIGNKSPGVASRLFRASSPVLIVQKD